MSDSEATPGPSIHEYLRPKLFAHSSDRLELTETSSSELSKVAEALNPKRINVSSRHPDNQQAIKCNVGIALYSTPSVERSISFRLPPELLEAIFLEHAQYYRDSTHVPRWVAVSYVCRYWRNVALGCAHLWAYPFFVSPEWMDEQLR